MKNTITDIETLARLCAQAAADKKAERIKILDLRGISTFTDLFVVCSGTSDPQLKAISNGIQQTLREEAGVKPHAVDGFPSSHWIVLDYLDVVVHIFHESKRDFYGLEDLWSDAPEIEFEES